MWFDPKVLLVDFSEIFIEVAGEYAFVTKCLERPVKAAKPSEQVNDGIPLYGSPSGLHRALSS